jgi:hypothetical protein
VLLTAGIAGQYAKVCIETGDLAAETKAFADVSSVGRQCPVGGRPPGAKPVNFT